MKITPQILDDIRGDLKEAVSEIEEKYNMDFKFGNASFSELEFRMTINAALMSDECDNVDQFVFNKYASKYGLKPTDYMRDAMVQGNKMKLVALNPRAPKYPYGMLAENGKRYKVKHFAFI